MFAKIKKVGTQEYIGIYKSKRIKGKPTNKLIRNYGNIKKYKGKTKKQIIEIIMGDNSMLLKDITTGQGKININLQIIEVKEANKRPDGQIVQTVIVEDAQANKARLDLWNEKANKYTTGQKIRLVKGYARNEYEGLINLTPGKYGEIEII